MKAISVTLALAFIMILSSCSKTENSETLELHSLDGDWSLRSYICFCPPFPDLEPDVHTWSINLSEETLRVQTQLENPPYDILRSDIEYQITEEENVLYIKENNLTQAFDLVYTYRITGDTLVLDGGTAVDGPLLIMTKN